MEKQQVKEIIWRVFQELIEFEPNAWEEQALISYRDKLIDRIEVFNPELMDTLIKQSKKI